MCKDCGKPDTIVGHYINYFGIRFTIETCKRCRGITNNKA